ncbi:gfo/Idh/MocA family oxidoreductase, partial [Planctomycetota bacterium]
TNGSAVVESTIEGPNAYEYQDRATDPFLQEHIDLIESIKSGEPLNEGKQIAESTMCSIMARMSAYTGRALQWDWVMNASQLDLTLPKYELGDLPVRPVAVPGKTKLI